MKNSEVLNGLDGDSVYKEVLAEKVEKDRRAYKQAIKNAVVRNDAANTSAEKALNRSDKTKKVLTELVEGGMEGFLAKEEEIAEDDDDSGGDVPHTITKRPFFKHRTSSIRHKGTGQW